MKPRERRETGQNDLFKARLDQIIDMSHPRVQLAQQIDWNFSNRLSGRFIRMVQAARLCPRG